MDLIQQTQKTVAQLVGLETRLDELRQRAEQLLAKRQEAHAKASADCEQVVSSWQAVQAAADSGRQQIDASADGLQGRLNVLQESARQAAEDCSRQVEEALAPLRTLHEQLDDSASQLEALRTKTEEALMAASQRALELFEQARRPLEETTLWLKQDFSRRLQEHSQQLEEQAQRVTLLGTEAAEEMEAECHRNAGHLEVAGDNFRQQAQQVRGQLQDTAETAVRELESQQRVLLDQHAEAGERLSKGVQQIAGGVGEVLYKLQEMDARVHNDARTSNEGIDAVLRLAEDYRRVLE